MRLCRLIVRLCVLLGLIAGASLLVWGQATTSLRGTVTDVSGAIVPHANVTLTNVDTNAIRETTTTAAGLYEISSVQPGNYKLTVTAKGFATAEQTGITLQVSLPATQNIQLKVGASSQTVEVTGEAPLLNTTDNSMGHNMGSQEIEQLPILMEQMPLLLSFQAGVVFNGNQILTDSYDTRAGAVNGERSDQNNITLDGVSDNDEFAGYAFTGVLPTTQFSVQEFRVTTSNYDASQGRSAGAQTAMVTKGGTNQFHGNLYEFNRNTVGEANDFFIKNTQIANGLPNTPQKLIHNTFGGTFGGPLWKNRLFFFFNYQGERQSFGESVQRTIPSSTLRDGIIQYACADATQCPGMSVTGLSGKSYNIPTGMYALNASQLQMMDPLHIGPSSAMMGFFNTYQQPNTSSPFDSPNFAGYRFAAPTTQSWNWYIARLDYNITQDGNHTLFLRGAARDDHNNDVPFLPGFAPEDSSVDLSKGFVAGYTGAFTQRVVNNFRYGLTHQSIGTLGNTSQPWVQVRDMDQPIVYSSEFTAPVGNLADTLSWQKGTHNIQFGTNMLFIRRGTYGYTNSYSDALTNADYLFSGGFANKNSPLNPANAPAGTCPGGCPAVSSGFNHSYDFPLVGLMGILSEMDARYNYAVSSLTGGSALPQGAPLTRFYNTDTYNFFVQDTWQIRHNLTLSYGLNYQLMTPITEMAGQEVAPNWNMGTWFNQRAQGMLQGLPDNRLAPITFEPSGSAWGRSGLYGTQTKNFAPRLGFAWSPSASGGFLKTLLGDNATSIRAGAGMYYDNFGPALALSYAASGEFGLSSLLPSPAGTFSPGCGYPGAPPNCQVAPRATGINDIPFSNPYFPQPTPPNFPSTPPASLEIAHGINQNLKTPYSYAVNLSIERQLPGHMVLDAAYVGHFGHRLLGLLDIAAPLNIKDPKSGVDYFSAASRLSQMWRQYCASQPKCGTVNSATGQIYEPTVTASSIGPTSAYWQNMFTTTGPMSLCTTGGGTTSMLQQIFDTFGPGCGNLYNETSGLFYEDLNFFNVQPVTGPFSYYNSQYSSLWAWSNVAHSNYNALQLGLHKDMRNGILFGLNYTYSKSLDNSSQAERGIHYLTDSIMNSFSPNQMYAPSDFDLRHQVNGYWVAELPFGHNKMFGSNMNGVEDALLGGWQLGGTVRWTSGYPASVFMGYVWPTNWDEMGWANRTSAPLSMGTTIVNGLPFAFTDPTAAAAGPNAGGPFDYAYPGQSGSRNNIRGDGYFTMDANLSKTWKIREKQSFQLRWSVFNVTNTTRFDIYSMNDEWDSGAGSFGQYSSTLTTPRVMEFTGIFTF